MNMRMPKGGVAFLNGQALIYDDQGIALRLTPGNLNILRRSVASNLGPMKMIDMKKRRFTAEFNKEDSTFTLITASDLVDVQMENLLQTA